jgi:RNA polymerase sigma-70 factor (ECF subfamily)
MDFVQAVWTSVLVKESPGVAAVADAEQFRGYLAGVARNKVLQEYRRRTRTRKYDLAREEPLQVRRGDGGHPRDLAGCDPSPSEEAVAAELLVRLQGGDPAVAEIVALRRQGLTFEQIAARTNRSDRAVRRLLDEVRHRLEPRG